MTQFMVLVFAIFMGVNAVAYGDCDTWLHPLAKARTLTENQEIEQHWAKTALSIKTLAEIGIFNAEACRQNADEAITCITLLDALARSGQPPYALIPQTALKYFDQEILSVEQKIGFLTLVRIRPDFKWGTGREYKDTVVWINKRKALLQDEIRQAFAKSKIDYSFLFDLIVNKVVTAKREAAQVAAAINAVLELSDSHSHIQSTAELLVQDRTAGDMAWGGIGVSILIINGHPEIDQVYPRGPAARAGLKAGDQIISVDGLDEQNSSATQLRKNIQGRIGSAVSLQVSRYGEVGQFKIVREAIKINNVTSHLVSLPKQMPVGHIIIRSFLNDDSCREVQKQIESLERRGVVRLVLDLRSNTGGRIEQAKCIAGLFIGKKIIARQTRLDNGAVSNIFATTKKITSLPLVVLINALSASSSELLAGALRDHHRAWIMGERSFGKGTMQDAFQFDLQTAAASDIIAYRTVARFEQPSGSSNQRYGITPQFPVPQSPVYPDEPMPREEDMSPFSPAPLGKKWREDQPEVVRKIKRCLKDNGQADVLYMLGRAAGKSVDYQILNAADLLNCMAKIKNENMP